MKVLDKIKFILEKENIIYTTYGNKIKFLFIISVLFVIIYVCFSFYSTFFVYLKFRFIKENLNLENFKGSLVLLEILLKKLFLYFPIKTHVLFIFAIVLACFVDMLCGSVVLLLYIILISIFGLSIELNILIFQGSTHLLVTEWFSIDVYYTDELMINFAYKFLELFNVEFGTDYPIADPSLLAEWILKSQGNPGVLLEILLRVYMEYHKLILEFKKQEQQKKDKKPVVNPFWVFLSKTFGRFGSDKK